LSLVLIDKSAYARGGIETGAEDELCICAVTRLELLYSARSESHYARLGQDLAEFRDLRMDAETFAAAITAQRELASRGEHRIPIPDLLIAACAQQHAAAVVHVDRHYDVLARVMTFAPRRLG
jgi:predicted nucleic acid-binding protein